MARSFRGDMDGKKQKDFQRLFEVGVDEIWDRVCPWSKPSVNVESNSLMLIDLGGSMFHYRRTSLAISRHLLLGLNQKTNVNAFGDIT